MLGVVVIKARTFQEGESYYKFHYLRKNEREETYHNIKKKKKLCKVVIFNYVMLALIQCQI